MLLRGWCIYCMYQVSWHVLQPSFNNPFAKSKNKLTTILHLLFLLRSGLLLLEPSSDRKPGNTHSRIPSNSLLKFSLKNAYNTGLVQVEARPTRCTMQYTVMIVSGSFPKIVGLKSAKMLKMENGSQMTQ